MDAEKTQNFVEEKFTNSVVPTLVEYIKIPNLSPSYDPDWDSNGTPEKACELIVNWINAQGLKNAKLEVFKEPGKTHVILVQIDGTDKNDHTVLFYGHFDKQPPSEGWWEGYGATTPVLTENNTKLYGRGAADDGYAVFSAVTAVKAVQEQGVPHSRIVILIEAGEESGSPDLPYYLDKFKNDVLKEVELVVTLDSGCATYDQLWLTSSLRGVLIGNLRVKILNEGVHSGDASGVVPSSFRIARQLLDRIENSETGVLIDYLSVEIPEERIKETRDAAAVVGDECWKQFPFVEGAKPLQTDDLAELMLNRTWRPTLSITGAAGLPDVSVAGNVLRPQTELKLSIRLPPTLNPLDVLPKLKETLESNPPYGAQVDFITDGHFGAGWNAPIVSDWLKTSLEKGSQEYFGSGYKTFGEGGSIPLMGVLHDTFPNAQFVITGVLGPASNAHGPNEFLHIPCCKKLTCCMAHVVEDHYKHTHK